MNINFGFVNFAANSLRPQRLPLIIRQTTRNVDDSGHSEAA